MFSLKQGFNPGQTFAVAGDALLQRSDALLQRIHAAVHYGPGSARESYSLQQS